MCFKECFVLEKKIYILNCIKYDINKIIVTVINTLQLNCSSMCSQYARKSIKTTISIWLHQTTLNVLLPEYWIQICIKIIVMFHCINIRKQNSIEYSRRPAVSVHILLLDFATDRQTEAIVNIDNDRTWKLYHSSPSLQHYPLCVCAWNVDPRRWSETHGQLAKRTVASLLMFEWQLIESLR